MAENSRQPYSPPRAAPVDALPRDAVPARRLRLHATSDPANLAPVRHACEKYCVDHGLLPAAANDVGLCINEAMANITRHAYGGAVDRPIDITCEDVPAQEGGGVRVSIRDWGNGVNPATLPGREPNPETPGGLGLICLRRLMDEANYVPQPDGMMLVMVKRKGSADRNQESVKTSP